MRDLGPGCADLVIGGLQIIGVQHDKRCFRGGAFDAATDARTLDVAVIRAVNNEIPAKSLSEEILSLLQPWAVEFYVIDPQIFGHGAVRCFGGMNVPYMFTAVNH